MLDPFRPEREEDIVRLKSLQSRIHDHFIAHVSGRRGDRLNRDHDLFTGEIFVGGEAVDAGLVDGLAHSVEKLQSLYGEKVRLSYLGPRRSLIGRFLPRLSADAFAAIEERAVWARFGL